MRRTAEACACWSIGGGSEGRSHRVPRRCDFDLSEPDRWCWGRSDQRRLARAKARCGDEVLYCITKWTSDREEGLERVQEKGTASWEKMAHTHAQLHLAKASSAHWSLLRVKTAGIMGPCKAQAQAASLKRKALSGTAAGNTDTLDDLERESPLRSAPRVDLPPPPPSACLAVSPPRGKRDT